MNRLDLVPWAVRSDLRHRLKYVGESCYTIRDCMPIGDLNLDGCVEDIDQAIAELTVMRADLAKWLPAKKEQ